MDYHIWLALSAAFCLILVKGVANACKKAFDVFDVPFSQKRSVRARVALDVFAFILELAAVILVWTGLLNEPFMQTWIRDGHFAAAALVVLSAFLVLTIISLVFGYYLPRRRYVQLGREDEDDHSKRFIRAEKRFRRNLRMVRVIDILFFPLSVSIIAGTRLFLKLCGYDPHFDETKVTEQELLSMVEDGSESGVLDSDDVKFIKNAMSLDELSVGDIATHRTEMDFLWADDSLDTWDSIIRQSSHRYLPICTERVDQITGVLNANVYLRIKNPSYDEVIREAVTKPFYVPETMMADTLLSEMKKSRTYFAVVIDEYGGTHGIITLTDVLSKLVGDLDEADEAEDQVPEIRVHKDGSVTVDASMELLAFSEYFGVGIEAESHTVGGWITEMYGDIPEKGTFFEIKPFKVRVTESDPRHVTEALIVKEQES